MGAIASLLGSVFSWIAAQLLARWGYKVALVTVVIATFTVCYGTFLAAFLALKSLLPNHPLTPFVLQFMPSASAVAIAISAVLGSMAVKKACSYWVKVMVASAKIAA